MRKFTAFLVALLLACPLFSQQDNDTMYIHLNDGTLQRIAVALVDSVTFVSPSVETPDTPSDSTSVPDRSPAEAIDLGLSVKWASCNVGATSPEDYGGYYAWGETEEKSDYSWETYKWCNGSDNTLTKYCTEGAYGTVDNKTVLDPADDVAHVKWGGSWRMPTFDEIIELRDKCSWSWTSLNGIDGYKVTGPNGNSIFLPAAGYRFGAEVYYSGSFGDYWSASLYGGSSSSAFYLYFYSNYHDWNYYYYRYNGFSVRPVSE